MEITARDRLRQLVDRLPENELETVERVLAGLSALSLADPVAAALARAPDDDEPVTDREAALMEEGERDLRDGRTFTADEVRAGLGSWPSDNGQGLQRPGRPAARRTARCPGCRGPFQCKRRRRRARPRRPVARQIPATSGALASNFPKGRRHRRHSRVASARRLPVAAVLRSTFPLPHPPDAKFRRRFARRRGSTKHRGVAALPESRADPTVRNDGYGVSALDHAAENRASKGSGGRRSRGGVSTAMMRTAGSVTCCLTMRRWMSRLFRLAIRFRRRSAWLRRCKNWRKRGI